MSLDSLGCLSLKFEEPRLIRNLKRRTVFRPGLAVIVNPRRRDIGVAEPLLNLGNVRFMIERIGCRGGAQRMSANLKSQQG
jgi:hypothetical protein